MRPVRLPTGAFGILLAALATAPAGVGPGTLYMLREDGVLRSLDPLTGEVRTTVAITLPGKVVSRAHGLAVDPRNGDVLALVQLDDDCAADPTRTRFLRSVESCYDLSAAECESAYDIASGSDGSRIPASCAWIDGRRCEACTEGRGCLNTCLAPPPCPGTTREFAGVGESACRRRDGDEAGCAGAYHFGPAGAAACFFEDGSCLGCDPLAEAGGRCERGCAPLATCAAAGRTLFAGEYPGCRIFHEDPAACSSAYAGRPGATAACEYDGGCWAGPACDPPPPVEPCPADPSRDVILGYCSSLGDDRAACARTVARDDLGFYGCFVPEGEQSCRSCDDSAAAQRECFDPCTPPLCAADPVRSLAGLDEADCRAFDGDAGGCSGAFVQGRCGPAACTFDATDGECRACEPGDPGACENACGAFEIWGRETLVRVDPASGAATPVREIAGNFTELGVDGAGTPYVLGWTGQGCFEDSVLHDVSTARVRPASLFDVMRGRGVTFAADGALYRIVQGRLSLARYDLASGESTTRPVSYLPADLRGFTYVPGCDGFLVARRDGVLVRMQPDATRRGILYALPDGVTPETNGKPEIAGIAASPDAACPPERPIPTTTSTIPNERLAGTRLVLTDRPGHPERRRLVVTAKDATVTLGRGTGSPDDPVLEGGLLRVRATAAGGFDATYELRGRWRVVRRRGEIRGYRWTGPPPITSIVVKHGTMVRVLGRGAALEQSLVGDPVGVAIDLVLGERPYCVEFGGEVEALALRRFVAKNAPPPAACRSAGGVP
jgi:hypothetical protein